MKPAGWISGNDWHFQQLSEISGDPWKQKRAEPYASPGSGPGHGLLKREPLSIVITYTLSCAWETGRSENVKHERWWGNRCLSPFKYKFMVPMGEQHMNLSATLASRDGPWTRIWAGPPEDGEEQQKAQPASGLGTPWTPPGQDDWLYGADKLCLCKSGKVCPQLCVSYLGVTERQSSVIAKHQWTPAWVLQLAWSSLVASYGSAWAA